MNARVIRSIIYLIFITVLFYIAFLNNRDAVLLTIMIIAWLIFAYCRGRTDSNDIWKEKYDELMDNYLNVVKEFAHYQETIIPFKSLKDKYEEEKHE